MIASVITPSQVMSGHALDLKAKIAVAIIGIFGILITLNFLHPQSMDAIVIKPVLEIAS